MNLSLAALDYEQAKAASLLYLAGDSVAFGPHGELYRDDEAVKYDAASDALFEGHGHGPYSMYNGKNLAARPNPILKATTYGSWTFRTYRSGKVDAVPTDLRSVAISPGFDSIEDALAWVDAEGEHEGHTNCNCNE